MHLARITKTRSGQKQKPKTALHPRPGTKMCCSIKLPPKLPPNCLGSGGKVRDGSARTSKKLKQIMSLRYHRDRGGDLRNGFLNRRSEVRLLSGPPAKSTSYEIFSRT